MSKETIVKAAAAMCAANTYNEIKDFVLDTNSRFGYDLDVKEVIREMRAIGKEVMTECTADSLSSAITISYPDNPEKDNLVAMLTVVPGFIEMGNIEAFADSLVRFVDDWAPAKVKGRAPKYKARWGRKHLDRLRSCINDGHIPYPELSKEMGRSISAVRTMVSKIRRGLA